jgi:hypothetical protein
MCSKERSTKFLLNVSSARGGQFKLENDARLICPAFSTSFGAALTLSVKVSPPNAPQLFACCCELVEVHHWKDIYILYI